MAIRASGPGWLGFLLPPPVAQTCHQTVDLLRTCQGTFPCFRTAASACARRAVSRTALTSLTLRRGRPRFSSALGAEDLPADQLWWGVASPVKSLQISCRDAGGNALDPWRLSELMMDMGAMSVSVDDSSLGTDEEIPIMDEEVFNPLSPVPSETGRKEMWEGRSRVKALFPGEWDVEGVMSSVREVFDLSSPLTFEVGSVDNEDWIKNVQEGWDPIEVGRLRVRFPWHEVLPSSQARPGQVELELEGGSAFGTGEHPTTSLCLEWLEEKSSGQRVLDYGSGSGILGLAALKFGAKETVGVELDPGAILSAAGNAERNGLRMDTYYPREIVSSDQLEDVLLTRVSTKESVAELLSVSAYSTGGKLALSGVFETQAKTVVDAYENDFSLKVTRTMEGWVLISGVRRATESYS